MPRPLTLCVILCQLFFVRGHACASDEFAKQVQPFLQQFCFDCHNADNMESGIRVDDLDGTLSGTKPFLWQHVEKQLRQSAMPPDDADQPSLKQKENVLHWIDQALLEAKRRPREKNGSVRRLTVSQYQNTLEQLLGIKDDLRSLLPPDAVSKDGFLNNEQTMIMSPRMIEAYIEVAQRALDLCLVDEHHPPTIQHVRVDFGRHINPTPYPDPLILGPNNLLLRNEDFVVSEPVEDRGFRYNPFRMRTKYRFNEGYAGNSTVRGWRDYDSIYHAVYACMRGDKGYPIGEAYSVVPDGLLLRPAIPNIGRFGVSTTYGPKANFKISLRELPSHGDLRVTVTAAKYDDGILLHPRRDDPQPEDNATFIASLSHSREANLSIEAEGIFQVDVHHDTGDKQPTFRLALGDRYFSGKLNHQRTSTAFLLVRLPEGPLRLVANYEDDNNRIKRVAVTRMAIDSEHGRRFVAFEKRTPTLSSYLGLRRDCGSSQSPFAEPEIVTSTSPRQYVFQDAIRNHPSPDVQDGNDNYLAGMREIGVRSVYTDGRDMPRVLIKSVDIEGPFYESWPPQSHAQIFVDSKSGKGTEAHGLEILRRFAKRAFRRPLDVEESTWLENSWKKDAGTSRSFNQRVRDVLFMVLTSPQCVFLIETSESPDAEPLDEFELASKLAYFLWNGPPDKDLISAAESGTLRRNLRSTVLKMMDAPGFDEFAQQFTSQWLALDKLDVVETDRKRFPRFLDEVKDQLRREPVMLMRYLLKENRPVSELVRADYVVANEVVADYYGVEDKPDSGLEFIPVRHNKTELGGLLSQAGVLAGLSDGREANPVKRGAWLARKIVAEPPEDPPPNVPAIDEDNESLSLRKKLERHRNQDGCVKCHEGIDPWGLPLECFDASGLFRENVAADSELPDGTKVRNVNELKDYLAEDRIDQVAFSFLKHLATYATGRDLSFSEIEYLREGGVELGRQGYPMRDMLLFVVQSPLFLEK